MTETENPTTTEVTITDVSGIEPGNVTAPPTAVVVDAALIDQRDQRIAELEQQLAQANAELEQARAAAAAGVQDLSTGEVPPPPDAPDPDARKAELVAQGLSEADAEQQAAYEARTHADRQGGVAA